MIRQNKNVSGFSDTTRLDMGFIIRCRPAAPVSLFCPSKNLIRHSVQSAVRIDQEHKTRMDWAGERKNGAGFKNVLADPLVFLDDP
jgi:hypothetical protein